MGRAFRFEGGGVTKRVGLDDFNSVAASKESALADCHSRRVAATPFSQIERKRVEWLDQGRVPIGLVTILGGYGGLGKSQWEIGLCARLSRGELGEPAVSLIATAEDDEETTVRPRLEAAGANLELVHSLAIQMGDGTEDGLSLPDDLTEVEARVEQLGAKLLIVDPIVAFLPQHIDSHKDQSVRRALAPLYRLARKNHCAVVATIHLNKTQGLKPLQRLSGSGGFGNAARSVLLLDHDPDDPEGEDGNRRVLAQIKTNIARKQPSLTYEIKPILLPATDGMPEVETTRFELVGESTHNGESLLEGEGERAAVGEAEEFLLDLLSDGTRHPAAEIYRDAAKLHISPDRLKRARKKIGAKSAKADFSGGWEWWNPQPSTKGAPTREVLLSSHSSHSSWRNAEGSEASEESEESDPHELQQLTDNALTELGILSLGELQERYRETPDG
jgi:AAA domain-containing protein